MLTRKSIKLSGDRNHHDVILHDVRHFILQVLLIECDQGIWAGIPNLNERPIMPAVYESMPKCIPYPYIHIYIYIYSWSEKWCFVELNTSKMLKPQLEVGTMCKLQTHSDEGLPLEEARWSSVRWRLVLTSIWFWTLRRYLFGSLKKRGDLFFSNWV